jgi:hypothetical protein
LPHSAAKPQAVCGQRSTESTAFWRYVGQVGNPPLSGNGQFIGRPIANRPQDAILPYIAVLEPQRGAVQNRRGAQRL